MSIVKAAEWSVGTGRSGAAGQAKLLQSASLPIVRRTKGRWYIDIKPYLYRLELKPSGRLEMLLAMGGTGGTKPREVLELLEICCRFRSCAAKRYWPPDYLQSPWPCC